jgi:phospholipid/cholesterol/gamma-HCH transport system permease protein
VGARGRRLDEWVAAQPGYGRLESARGMVGLSFQVARAAVRPPYPWFRDFVEHTSLGIRRSIIPLTVAVGFFSFGILQTALVGITESLGAVDRFGLTISASYPREGAFWVTSMIIAGALGSSVTADLGSRKIREELDAIKVLGVDPVKSLVVPRVLALLVLGPILVALAMFIGLGVGWLVTPTIDSPRAVFVDSARTAITSEDLISLMLRAAVTGLIVGVVSTYKGLEAKGGAEGVGQAVRETVIITFLALWLLNTLWNLAFLSLWPEVSVPRG